MIVTNTDHHAPTHTARRETDDVGCVWLRRRGFWATRPAQEPRRVAGIEWAQVGSVEWAQADVTWGQRP